MMPTVHNETAVWEEAHLRRCPEAGRIGRPQQSRAAALADRMPQRQSLCRIHEAGSMDGWQHVIGPMPTDRTVHREHSREHKSEGGS